jgi:integrase
MKRRASGEGSICKDSRGYWIAQFTTPDGKRKRKASKKQSVVKEWLATSLAQVREGTYVEDSKLTVAQYFDSFMNNVAPLSLRPRTIETYRWVESHLIPDLGDMRLSLLRPSHLQALYAKKLEAGLSKRSVIKIHEVTRRILNQAVKFGLIAKNPALSVQPPTPDNLPIRTLTVDEIRTVLEHIRGTRWYPIYCIAIGCGLRESEILGLRKQDVQLNEGVLRVEQTIYTIKGKVFIGSPKSASSRRVVGLPDFVAFSLRELWEETEYDQLLFRTKNNTPIGPRNLLRHFHNTLDELNISRVSFHSLRHFYVTLMIARGATAKDVSALAGHSSIQITYNVYGHLMPGYQKEAAKKLDGLV